MDTYPETSTLDTDSDLARLLAQAKRSPVIVAANGVRYRMEPEDPWAFDDPEKAREAFEAAAGSWAGRGVFEASAPVEEDVAPALDPDDHGDRRRIREAKPRKKSVENGAETRYGHEISGNARSNEALDAYEAALLERLAAHEADE